MPERKKGRSRHAGVRLGRSRGPSSPSRRRWSGSGGRRLRLAVRPAQGSRSRPRPRRDGRALARSASEPALLYGARVHPVPRGLSPPSPPAPPLERPHTCFDVFSPDSPFGRSTSASSLPNCNPWEEAKVVVSVTVEGSVGPVKAMVKLGASVGEAIAAVVERYGREGRSPRLDPAAAEAFQLHRSHFCLEIFTDRFEQNDKIGDVGGRNFYLHKNGGSNGHYLQCEERNVNLNGGEITQSYIGQLAGAPYHHQFFAIVLKNIDKIGRRTKGFGGS